MARQRPAAARLSSMTGQRLGLGVLAGILAAARGMLALSAFLTVLGLVLLTQHVAGAAAAVIVASVVIASPDLARLHFSVWSEPPFLVCVVALLTAMVLEPDKPFLHGLLASLPAFPMGSCRPRRIAHRARRGWAGATAARGGRGR